MLLSGTFCGLIVYGFYTDFGGSNLGLFGYNSIEGGFLIGFSWMILGLLIFCFLRLSYFSRDFWTVYYSGLIACSVFWVIKFLEASFVLNF